MTHNSLAVAIRPFRTFHSELVDAAVRWQAGRDRRSDADLFTLICVGSSHVIAPDQTPTRWTRTGTFHTLRCDIPSWCATARCLLPDGLSAALWDWFDFLDETGRLDPASDPLCEIRKPLICYGGLDQRGRPARTTAPPIVECECFLPYRETVGLLNDLRLDAERRGIDLLDPLRLLVGRLPIQRDVWWRLNDLLPEHELDC